MCYVCVCMCTCACVRACVYTLMCLQISELPRERLHHSHSVATNQIAACNMITTLENKWCQQHGLKNVKTSPWKITIVYETKTNAQVAARVSSSPA